MPYIKKDDLKHLLRDAFGEGFWSSLAIDHEVDSLHIKQETDFEKFYEAYQTKHSKSEQQNEY